LFKMVEEFRRFFHQRSHYEEIEDVNYYLANNGNGGGAYQILNKSYSMLCKYIPKEIAELYESDNSPLQYPNLPYYYKLKKN